MRKSQLGWVLFSTAVTAISVTVSGCGCDKCGPDYTSCDPLHENIAEATADVVPESEWPDGLAAAIDAYENDIPGIWDVASTCGTETSTGTIAITTGGRDGIVLLAGDCNNHATAPADVTITGVHGIDAQAQFEAQLATYDYRDTSAEKHTAGLIGRANDELFTLTFDADRFAGTLEPGDGSTCTLTLTRANEGS